MLNIPLAILVLPIIPLEDLTQLSRVSAQLSYPLH